MSVFTTDYNPEIERHLIEEALSGSIMAIDQLINIHQQFIYNIALKFTGDKNDAKDLTQEVLIKVITKLAQFRFKSSFRTWLYRIAMNHLIDDKREKKLTKILSFDQLGNLIDQLYDNENMSVEEQEQYNDQIMFVRNKCLASMLLCLDQQQRIVYILGSIFNLKSPVASALLGISATNFRKLLSRAKEDLFQFMESRCGLINPENACRCFKKTKGFIKDGIVDPNTKIFSTNAIQKIASIAPEKTKDLDRLVNGKYLQLFVNMPYERNENEDNLVKSLLIDPEIINLFHLN